ncbi:Protein unc-93 A [Bulinus truncatus]|nr:Protein unc-93 A [Bulinus truncatus]
MANNHQAGGATAGGHDDDSGDQSDDGAPPGVSRAKDHHGASRRIHGTATAYGSVNNNNNNNSFAERGKTSTPASTGDEHKVLVTPQGQQDAVPPVQTLLAVSLSNLLVSTPYNGNQNIQSSINSQGSLGVIMLACVYAAVIVGAPFATSAIRKLGCKVLLLSHWTMNIVYISANFYPKFYTLLPVSIMLGFTCSCLGTVNSLYLTAASDSYIFRKRLSKGRQHIILSIFFGIFFTFAESSQVTGNLISSLVLYMLSPPTGNMTDIKSSVCGSSLCPGDNMTTTAFTQPSQATLYILYGIFLGSILLGWLITWFMLPALRAQQSTASVCREISGCFRVLVDPRFSLLAPIIMGQAMTVMILFTGFTQAFVSCTLGVEWVGFIMMTYGASTAFFATVANYLARYLGRISLMVIFILIDSGILVTMLIWSNDSKLMLFSIAAVAGISEGISQPQFNSIVSMIFRDDLPSAFVAYNMIKCFGFSVSLGISTFACLYHRLYVAISLYGLGLIGYITTEILVHKRASKKDHTPLIADKEKSVARSSFKKIKVSSENKL